MSLTSALNSQSLKLLHQYFYRVSTRNMRQVNCPQCKKPTEFSPENSFRPFCSNRCKLIDLGQWADEGYKIPSNKPIDGSDEALDDASNLN